MRRVLVAALAALVLPSAALAAGPSYVAQGSVGILGKGGKNRFVAVSTGGGTAIARISVHGGAVNGWATLSGEWGIPQPTFSAGRLEGLTRDGKRLIVGTVGATYPSRFAVLDTKTLRSVDSISLDGRFAYDALSPDGKTLYLSQYVDEDNAGRYVVRGYDLEQHELLPGRIADKAQHGWVMEGFAVTRTTSADGRWVYTLFMRPGGYPFVHALDTVNARALHRPSLAQRQPGRAHAHADDAHGRREVARTRQEERQAVALDRHHGDVADHARRPGGLPLALVDPRRRGRGPDAARGRALRADQATGGSAGPQGGSARAVGAFAQGPRSRRRA
jgi:hypothetical protein